MILWVWLSRLIPFYISLRFHHYLHINIDIMMKLSRKNYHYLKSSRHIMIHIKWLFAIRTTSANSFSTRLPCGHCASWTGTLGMCWLIGAIAARINALRLLKAVCASSAQGSLRRLCDILQRGGPVIWDVAFSAKVLVNENQWTT